MKEALGKIDHQLFEGIIRQKCGKQRAEVSTVPQFGVDVSVVDLPGGMAMVNTSDPLSLIPSLGLEESAWLSVHLMANDMATTGFAPMYAQFVLNLPSTFSKTDFEVYWNYIHTFCAEIGTAITGGHTGFVEGQNSTIAGGGTFTTVAPKSQILTSTMAKSGDSILVTKQCAISSAAILAMSFPETIKNKLGNEVWQKASESFYDTSSLKEALVAVGPEHHYKEVTAMHDVTEGGVLGAIYEMVSASAKGALIYDDQLPIGYVQNEVCELFNLDQRNCVGAGSMIISCKKGAEASVIDRLKTEGINCTVVGEVKEPSHGIKIVEQGEQKDMIYIEEDPYWAAFFKAFKAGWK